MSALRTYKEKHGHLVVPYNFVVPNDDASWPPIAWGYNLGIAVSLLRSSLNRCSDSTLPSKVVEELEGMGFVTSTAQFKWDTIIMPSLRRYYDVHGHSDVSQLFVVPSGDRTWPQAAWGHRLGMTPFKVPEDPKWPRKAWGLNLGNVVHKMRRGNCYAEQVARDKHRLEAIGFAWNHGAVMWNDRILPAIKTFTTVYPHCKVPQKFVVPSQEPWPGRSYFSFYSRGIEKLDELGLNLKLSARAWQARVAPLLDIYATTSQAREIPENFVISSKAPWAEEMWGIRLGLIVARNSHHLPRQV
ncbi:hypothetical protein PHYPSEUDO_009336 [Phytophthora pseudosyringae]|uniref:Helicase-associated domain-containing protein n=1 Tax=Phytophthora pseudosyringae TaxID=221518 RepID=A0A8T1VFE6_9STRA|nr:hypothetical protein PHYPSEUDO_009336 [Phytophthora pseudosyringae]